MKNTEPRVVWIPSGAWKSCYIPIRDPLNSWEFEGVIGLPVLHPVRHGRNAGKPFVVLTLAHMPIHAVTGERRGRYPIIRPIFTAHGEVAEELSGLEQGTYVIARGEFARGWKKDPIITAFEVVEDPESRARGLGTEAFLDAALGT